MTRNAKNSAARISTTNSPSVSRPRAWKRDGRRADGGLSGAIVGGRARRRRVRGVVADAARLRRRHGLLGALERQRVDRWDRWWRRSGRRRWRWRRWRGGGRRLRGAGRRL